MSNGVPLVEFYRPTNFEEIVLDPLNKKILKNIIVNSYFPNLLFYGPPGTGKTTTIINLINAYQEKLNIKNKDLIIHLNASDERGIDIIRNQINFFVNSKPLFYSGMKFVILDEVDYMTKNAQQALRYLLQNFTSGVRFCLICNYISKIDEGLKNEFTKLLFNQLTKDEIINFLKHISKSENLNLTDKSLFCIQQLYNSDIRSMINFMQSNQDVGNQFIGKEKIEISVIDKDIWELLIKKITKKEKLDKIAQFIYEISINHNIDKKNIIKNFINYIIRNYPKYINNKFLYFIENLTHTQNQNSTLFVYYALTKLQLFIK